MSSRSGKNKGSSFERWFCKELSLWWTGGESDTVFWRTDSGARATGRTKRGKRTKGQYGDIVATDPIGAPLLELVVFELKRGYNQATIADLLDKPPKAAKQAYEKWIAKAREDANAAGVPYWLLIHKRDKREPVIFLPIDLMRVPAFNSGDISSRATINVQAEGLYIYAAYLKDFFKEVQPPLLSIHDLCPTPKKKSG